MQNRFSLKDFVLYVLIGIVLIVAILSMKQNDRAFDELTKSNERLRSVESQLGRMDTTVGGIQKQLQTVSQQIESGVRVSGPAAPGQTNPSATTPPPAGARDESWARPGVAVEWQPPMAFESDPRKQPGFVEGGEITEIWEAQTKVITPAIATDVYSRRVEDLVLESLATYNPATLKHEGVLAEAWQIDPKGLWLRARLRDGIRFSDGTPITAEDFRWTFHEYYMNEQIEAERARSILRDSIAKVEAIDPRTVEVTFKEALYFNIPNALSLPAMPKHFYSQFSPAEINRSTGLMMGSGPFRVRGVSRTAQWAPPEDIVLERNEQYWGPRPALATIRFKGINEELARINSFAKGDAQIITPSSPQFVSRQRESQSQDSSPIWREQTRFLQWVNMRSGYSFIAWNNGERNGKLTPFHDRRVRLAMTHALDRERFIRDIYSGIGQVAKGNMPLASPGSNKDIKPWPFDPNKAIALLKEAGWEDRNGDNILEDKFGSPFKFQFTYAGGSEISDRIARFTKDSFEAIGIQVELRSVEWAVYTDLLKTRDFDAITLGWGSSAPESDPTQIFHSKSIQNQGDNFAQWNSPEADRLIDAGRREMDFDKRMAIWRQFEAVLHEEQPYTFLRVSPWLRFATTDLGNLVTYPKGLEPVEYFRGSGAAVKPAN
jgi:peptide/nickel transport system substrate-binding protein